MLVFNLSLIQRLFNVGLVNQIKSANKRMDKIKTGRLSESPPAEINNAFKRQLINILNLINYVEFNRLSGITGSHRGNTR